MGVENLREPMLPFGAPVDPLEAAAAAFHARNPHVLEAIVDICLTVKRAGLRRWSIGAAFEVVRYNAAVSTDGRVYKLNNNHRAYYARWIIRDHPELRGFFSCRDSGRVEQGEEA